MILEIRSGGITAKIAISGHEGHREFRLDGRLLECDWLRVGERSYSIILDGRVFDVSVRLDGKSCSVTDRAGTRLLQVIDPRSLDSGPAFDAGSAGTQRICAEMPGKVIRVIARAGDAVTVDDALLVIEAMKMQNEIRAPKSGTVREVGVAAGRTVNTGDFLVSLE